MKSLKNIMVSQLFSKKKSYLLVGVLAIFACSKAELPTATLTTTTLSVNAVTEVGGSLDSAKVFLNGGMIGHTPLNIEQVNAGLYAIRVARPGFKIFSEQIFIEEGLDYSIEAILGELQPDQGQLLVTVNRDSALVQIFNEAGELFLETDKNASVHTLSPGNYLVTAEVQNCPKAEARIDVLPNEVVSVNLYLADAGVAPTLNLSFQQDSVLVGDNIRMSWNTDGQYVIIDQGVGSRGSSGAETLNFETPGARIFTATAYGINNMTTQATAQVVVYDIQPEPPTLTFSIEQDSLEFGEAATITWQSNGRQVIIDRGIGSRGPSGSEEVAFINPGTKIFKATAYGENNLLTIASDSVYVKEAELPENPMVMLSATRKVTINNPATITWQSQNADYIIVDYVQNAASSGQNEVIFTTPGIRIVRATAYNAAGYTSAADTIEVVEPSVTTVDDILISTQSVVRADQGENGYHSYAAGSFNVESAGEYRVYAEVWYNSGDDQLNESYYLDISDNLGNLELPRDRNAGNQKVIADDPGMPHTKTRDSGVFKLNVGQHQINIHHYAKISDNYPQLLNGSINGPESVKILGFRLVYID